MTSLYCVMSTVFRDQMYHPVYQKSAFLWHLWDMSCLKFQTNINTRCDIQCYVDRDIFISARADRQTDRQPCCFSLNTLSLSRPIRSSMTKISSLKLQGINYPNEMRCLQPAANTPESMSVFVHNHLDTLSSDMSRNP